MVKKFTTSIILWYNIIMKKDIVIDPFEEYIKQSEPSKKHKAYMWTTAIGLQQVDGLKVSDYLLDLAKRNIEDEITIDEVQTLIESYYKESQKYDANQTKEADEVSARISKILSEKAFNFSANELIIIHSRLFRGIYKHAGKIRDYNITKKEWVLDGDTVIYGNYYDLKQNLEYDLNQEKQYDYSNRTTNEIISHLARFVSDLWQIHPFGEGNTRTIAVFFIKYLNKLGYNVTNNLFAENSWYFRNSLVRANYNNAEKGINETTKYLESFLKNLLLNENNELKNRHLHIQYEQNQDIETKNQDIENKNQDIEHKKLDVYKLKNAKLNKNTIENIKKLYDKYHNVAFFGRKQIMECINIYPSNASSLIVKLLELNIIEKVKGHGKGKYRFR